MNDKSELPHKTPAPEYLAVADAAIAAVSHKQSRTPSRRRAAAVQLALFTVSEVQDASR